MKRYRLELSADYGRIELKNNISGKVEKFADFNTNGITLMALSCFYHGISMLDIEDPTPVFRCHPRPPRTKTLQDLVCQWARIAYWAQGHPKLKEKAYNAFCQYRDAMDDSGKYWDTRQHVVRCINGEVGKFGYNCTESIRLTDMEKQTIAGRIADTTVRFTREEYAGF